MIQGGCVWHVIVSDDGCRIPFEAEPSYHYYHLGFEDQRRENAKGNKIIGDSRRRFP